MVLLGSEDGVSVIIGTLLLILIVVTAAAGLALMVAGMQKQAMTRQSHLTDVASEQLKIQDISFSDNRGAMNATPWNITESRNWSSLEVTVLNLDTKDSSVQDVGIVSADGVRFALNYSSDGVLYNLSHWLTIPATQAKKIDIDPLFGLSSPVFIGEGAPVTVRIVTSYYNIFEKTFRAPSAVIKWKIETEDLKVAQRDVLLLDGSDSSSDGTITSWNWTLIDGAGTLPAPGSWADTENTTPSFYEGSKARVICPSAGPFLLNLTVTDDSGMKGTSLPVQVPADSLFNPPVKLDVTVSGPSESQQIIATIRDINGLGVKDLPVNFLVTSGNLTLDRMINKTDISGTALVTQQTGSGIVEVISGMLPPVERTVG